MSKRAGTKIANSRVVRAILEMLKTQVQVLLQTWDLHLGVLHPIRVLVCWPISNVDQNLIMGWASFASKSCVETSTFLIRGLCCSGMFQCILLNNSLLSYQLLILLLCLLQDLRQHFNISFIIWSHFISDTPAATPNIHMNCRFHWFELVENHSLVESSQISHQYGAEWG